MIIQNQNDFSVTKIGVDEKKETFFTIDPSNAVHLMKMLRNSLYSNKELAVIREYICNAVDANVANGSSKPIQIYAPHKGNPFRVRDFGTGLSPQDVHYFLTNYGASSKRDSNNQVGGFGIGFKSGFSYTDSFTVTSIYKGKQYVYLCALEGSERGMLTCVDECFTDAPSGIEINIPVPDSNTYSFNRELFRFLATMKYPFRLLNEENVSDHSPVSFLDLKRVCHHHVLKSLEIDNIPYSLNAYTGLENSNALVRMGEVTYPLDLPLLNRHLESDLRKTDSEISKFFGDQIPKSTLVSTLFSSPTMEDIRGKKRTTTLVIDIPIGTIAISPDREKLQYSDANKTLLIKFMANYHIEIYKTLVEELSDHEDYENNCDKIREFKASNWILKSPSDFKRIPIPNPFVEDNESFITRKYEGECLSANYLFGEGNWILSQKNIKSFLSSLKEMPEFPIISSLNDSGGVAGWTYFRSKHDNVVWQHGNIRLLPTNVISSNNIYFGPTSELKKKEENDYWGLDIIVTYGDMKAISIPLYLNKFKRKVVGKGAAFHIHFPNEELWLWFKNEYCKDIPDTEHKYLIYNSFLVHDIYAMKNKELDELVNVLDIEEKYVSPQALKPKKKIRRLPKNLIKVYRALNEEFLLPIFGNGNCGSTYYEEVEIDINEKQYFYFLIDRYELYYVDDQDNRYKYHRTSGTCFYDFLKTNGYLEKIVFIKPAQLPLIFKKDTQKNVISGIHIVKQYLETYIYDYVMQFEFQENIQMLMEKDPSKLEDYKNVIGSQLFDSYEYRYSQTENKLRRNVFILGDTLDTWKTIKDYYGGDIIPMLLSKLLEYYSEFMKYHNNSRQFAMFNQVDLKKIFTEIIDNATELIVKNHISWNKNLFEEEINFHKNKGTLFLFLLWQQSRNSYDHSSNLLAQYIKSLNY